MQFKINNTLNDIIINLKKSHKKLFPNNRNFASLYFAPGRINLIGEHTDYTGGLVFPAGIDRGTYILAKSNNTHNINLISLNFSEQIETIYLDKPLLKQNKWTDYILGVLFELNKTDSYHNGFDAIIFGNIPNGAGLSSSASLEMVAIMAILDINGKDLPLLGSNKMIDMVKLAVHCENDFVGVKCGIMDQFAVANAKKNKGIELDCNTLEFSYVDVHLNDYMLLVINTNKKRRLEESKYNKRRQECEKGFRILKSIGVNKEVLGQVTIEEWEDFKNNPVFKNNKIIAKRLNHVIKENYRVKKAQKALKNNDIKEFARLLNQSGDSLRNDYEVTGFHLDSLVEIARSCDGVIASRMTGAGFGGCTINIIKKDMLENVKNEIKAIYYKKTHLKPDFYEFTIGDGARKIII